MLFSDRRQPMSAFALLFIHRQPPLSIIFGYKLSFQGLLFQFAVGLVNKYTDWINFLSLYMSAQKRER